LARLPRPVLALRARLVFFRHTAATEIHTLSLHDALPICDSAAVLEALKTGLAAPLEGMGTAFSSSLFGLAGSLVLGFLDVQSGRSEEHTSELQSRENLVCRLLLEKKK